MRGINIFNLITGLILLVIIFSTMVLYYSIIYQKIKININPLINFYVNFYTYINNVLLSSSNIELKLPISSLGNCGLYYTNYNLFNTKYPKSLFYDNYELIKDYFKNKGYEVYKIDCENKPIYQCIYNTIKLNKFKVCCKYLYGVCEINLGLKKYLFFIKNYKIPVIRCENLIFYNITISGNKIISNFILNSKIGKTEFEIPYDTEDTRLPNNINIQVGNYYITYNRDIYKDYLIDLMACEVYENNKLNLIYPSYFYMKKGGKFYFTPNLLLQKYNPLKDFNECLKKLKNSDEFVECDVNINVKKNKILFVSFMDKLYILDVSYNNLIYIPLENIFKYNIYISKSIESNLIGILAYSKIYNYISQLLDFYNYLNRIIENYEKAKDILNNFYSRITLYEILAIYTIVLDLMNKVKDAVNEFHNYLIKIKNNIELAHNFCENIENYICTIVNSRYNNIINDINSLEINLIGINNTAKNIYKNISKYLFKNPEYISLSLSIIETSLDTHNFDYFVKHKEILIETSQEFLIFLKDVLNSNKNLDINGIEANLKLLIKDILNMDEISLDKYEIWKRVLEIIENILNEIYYEKIVFSGNKNFVYITIKK